MVQITRNAQNMVNEADKEGKLYLAIHIWAAFGVVPLDRIWVGDIQCHMSCAKGIAVVLPLVILMANVVALSTSTARGLNGSWSELSFVHF